MAEEIVQLVNLKDKDKAGEKYAMMVEKMIGKKNSEAEKERETKDEALANRNMEKLIREEERMKELKKKMEELQAEKRRKRTEQRQRELEEKERKRDNVKPGEREKTESERKIGGQKVDETPIKKANSKESSEESWKMENTAKIDKNDENAKNNGGEVPLGNIQLIGE